VVPRSDDEEDLLLGRGEGGAVLVRSNRFPFVKSSTAVVASSG
jgi:hypothetical protein